MLDDDNSKKCNPLHLLLDSQAPSVLQTEPHPSDIPSSLDNTVLHQLVLVLHYKILHVYD